MEGYQTDIQALLQDLSGSYGDHGPEQPPQPCLPYSRPISSPDQSQVESSMVSRNALASVDEQQPLYETQASRPSDAYTYSTHNDAGLDAYGSLSNLEIERRPADCCLDRALLTEPQLHTQWQANTSKRSLPAGRLSLPGHTAPHSPVNALQQSKTQKQRRCLCLRVLPMFHC